MIRIRYYGNDYVIDPVLFQLKPHESVSGAVFDLQDKVALRYIVVRNPRAMKPENEFKIMSSTMNDNNNPVILDRDKYPELDVQIEEKKVEFQGDPDVWSWWCLQRDTIWAERI